jgi:hypothetical protein
MQKVACYLDILFRLQHINIKICNITF